MSKYGQFEKILYLFGDYEKEYKFHPKRRWKFDYYFPDKYVAIEVEGGIFNKKAHGSITGILRDIEKYNEAQILGIKVIRIPTHRLYKSETLDLITRAIKSPQMRA